jgi:uncharacterized protein YjbI with pentapeptide repeats
VANSEQLDLLRKGVESWNQWREKNPGQRAQLREADLREADLNEANLRGASLLRANLSGANLSGAGLREAQLRGANLSGANLSGAYLVAANLRGAYLVEADLTRASLRGANLSGAYLVGANLRGAYLVEADLTRASLSGANLLRANLSLADLSGANLRGARLREANLSLADLSRARLREADLREANLSRAELHRADLREANLSRAVLVETNLTQATLDGCSIYGISAWDLELGGTTQSDLVITREGEPRITVDDVEVAQFVHLLLSNPKTRDVINTIGRKGVLILGRFSERKPVLDAIRTEVRRQKYVPIVFDFERPTDRDFSETVMMLAGMSRFIIADITRPKSVPLELDLTVPRYMIPFVPIIQEGERPFAMFRDLWPKHRDWVLDLLEYDSVEELVQVFEQAVIEPANEMHAQLEARKAKELVTRHAKDCG